jgi:hypothetical protein
MYTATTPPVDPAPATIAAVLAMHTGHIFSSSHGHGNSYQSAAGTFPNCRLFCRERIWVHRCSSAVLARVAHRASNRSELVFAVHAIYLQLVIEGVGVTTVARFRWTH